MKVLFQAFDIAATTLAAVLAGLAFVSLIRLFEVAPLALAMRGALGHFVIAGMLIFAATAFLSAFRGSLGVPDGTFEAREAEGKFMLLRIIGAALLALGAVRHFGLRAGASS